MSVNLDLPSEALVSRSARPLHWPLLLSSSSDHTLLLCGPSLSRVYEVVQLQCGREVVQAVVERRIRVFFELVISCTAGSNQVDPPPIIGQL